MIGHSARQIGRRNDIGHVCLSCRQQIRAVAAQHAQARWQSVQTHRQEPTDDWAANFNDLSSNAPPKPEKPEKTAKGPVRISLSSPRIEVAAGAASLNGSKRVSYIQPSAHLHRTSSLSDEVAAGRRRRVRESKDGADAREVAIEKRGRRIRPHSAARRRAARRVAESLHPVVEQKDETSDKVEEIAAQMATERAAELEQLQQTASTKAVEQVQHENDKPIGNPFAVESSSSSASGEGIRQKYVTARTSTLEDVKVRSDKASPPLPRDNPKTTTVRAIPRTRKTPPSLAADRTIGPLSISDRIKLKRDAPGWVLTDTSTQSAQGPEMGFFHLRDKDKVSPVPPPPATAVNSKPYGLEPPSIRDSDTGNADVVTSGDQEDSTAVSASLSKSQLEGPNSQEKYDRFNKGVESIKERWNDPAAPNYETEGPGEIDAEPDRKTVSAKTDQETQLRTAKVPKESSLEPEYQKINPAALRKIERTIGTAVQPADIAAYKKLREEIKTLTGIKKRRMERRLSLLARTIELDSQKSEVPQAENVKSSSGPTSSSSLEKSMVPTMETAMSQPEKPSPAETTSKGQRQKPQPVSEVETFVKKQTSRKSSTTGDNLLRPANELQPPADLPEGAAHVASIDAKHLNITPLDIPQPPVPSLAYGLDRVLFNPGVYQLQDPLSRVFNFDPYLQKIMPVTEFDFNLLGKYKTSSKDVSLAEIAKERQKKYIGSTSSMTETLGHFHYLLSGFRPLNLDMLSRGFPETRDDPTVINKAPKAIFLRRKENGLYAIDADKEHDSGGNVLMMLGKSMEKLLTMPKDDYERYRKSDSRTVPDEEKNAPEAYQYTTMGDFLMRSQLDAYDPRLPGTGTFDLKTRAVMSVRHDSQNFEPMVGYEIQTLQGKYHSYEREYYDMMRSTMLKYSLQARMGRMDGIFVAYHNVERMFGFQYLSMQDMDRALHGQIDPCLADQEFKISVKLLNEVLEMATAKFPDTSLRVHFETKPQTKLEPFVAMYIFAEPMTEEEIDKIQDSHEDTVAEYEKNMMGIEKQAEGQEQSALDESGEKTVSDFSDDPITPAADLTSSASAADTAFFDTIKDGEVPKKPLFAATLICMSKVNGATASPRPERLKPEDEWTVDYLLKEMSDPVTAWSFYEGTKARKNQAVMQARKEAVMNANGELVENYWVKTMKSLSQEGRNFRARLDKFEAQKEAVVFEPLDKSTAS